MPLTRQALMTKIQTVCNTVLAAFRNTLEGATMEACADTNAGSPAPDGTPVQTGGRTPGASLITPVASREYNVLKLETLVPRQRWVEETVNTKMYKQGICYIWANGTKNEVMNQNKWIRYISDHDLMLRSEMERQVAKRWITTVVENRLVQLMRNPVDRL